MALKMYLKVALTFHQPLLAQANPAATSEVIVMGLVWAQDVRFPKSWTTSSCPLQTSHYLVEHRALRNS